MFFWTIVTIAMQYDGNLYGDSSQGEEGRRQSCIPSGGGQRRGSGINRSSSISPQIRLLSPSFHFPLSYKSTLFFSPLIPHSPLSTPLLIHLQPPSLSPCPPPLPTSPPSPLSLPRLSPFSRRRLSVQQVALLASQH